MVTIQPLTPPPFDAVPHVNGDPHFQAFSGQKYDVCMGDKHTTCQVRAPRAIPLHTATHIAEDMS